LFNKFHSPSFSYIDLELENQKEIETKINNIKNENEIHQFLN